MYAVTLRAQTKDGRMDELKEFIKSKALPSLEVPGIISIGFLNPELNTNLGMAFLTNKESAEVFAEERTKNIMQVADVFASFPKVVEGEITLGKIYQDRSANDNEEAYVRVVFAKVDNSEAPTNFVNEKIFPIYEEADGLRGAGFFVADGEAVSWNIWDSEEAANVVVPKFNEQLSSAEGIFLEDPKPYSGYLYAGRNFVDINKT
tara:strand:- start:475 stop:1089 length:615 start_codon:yes stop_codon:yes gene_type:complete